MQHLTSEQLSSLNRFIDHCSRNKTRRRSFVESETSNALFQNFANSNNIASNINVKMENEEQFLPLQSPAPIHSGSTNAYIASDTGRGESRLSNRNNNSNHSHNNYNTNSSHHHQNDGKHCVQHNYHDHAFDSDDIYQTRPPVSKGGVTTPFPEKLYQMLDHIALNEVELSSIVSWQPHGRCFLVKKVKEFTSTVLPRFFQQKKYASFQRQLNLYGFNRITKGPDKGSYYHELFLRSKKFLCRGIARMKVKGTGARMASNPDQEPNFYKMPPMPPLLSADSSIPIQTDQHGRNIRVTPDSSEPTRISSSAMPPLELPNLKTDVNGVAAKNSSPLDKSDGENDIDGLNFVFDGMPFHVLNDGTKRRHSLMDMARRRSLLRRNSLITPNSSENSVMSMETDADFQQEIASVAELCGKKDMSDEDMCAILDRIIEKHNL